MSPVKSKFTPPTAIEGQYGGSPRDNLKVTDVSVVEVDDKMEKMKVGGEGASGEAYWEERISGEDMKDVSYGKEIAIKGTLVEDLEQLQK